MKITFITGHLCKERHALLNELALDLGELGAKVTVLTGFPSRRINDEVRNYYLNHPIEHIGDNVVVKRVGSRGGEGKGLFDRMLKYLALTWQLYKNAKSTPTDVYYIYSSPPFLGWMGIKLSKIAPTLYNAQDLFPDTLVRIKNYSNKNPLIAFLRYMEKKVYQHNTRIVTISNEMKHTINELLEDEEKISVIYNWADIDSIHHIEKSDNLLMDELGIDKNKFIVSYAGDIGLFQGWQTVNKAAKIIEKSNPNIHFAIIGSGSYRDELEKTIQSDNISNISLHPLQPASRLSEIYSIGDLELVAIEPGLSKMALPSKTWVIMTAGSALLALVDQTSDLAHIVKERNIGYTMEHGNAEGLAQMILEAYENQSVLKDMGRNARKFSEENTARKIQTEKYYQELKKISKE